MHDPQTWTQIETLFHQVLALPEEERQAFLKQAGCNQKIYKELAVLLSCDRHMPSLASPIRKIHPSLPPGANLGAYQIQKILGQGGMEALVTGDGKLLDY